MKNSLFWGCLAAVLSVVSLSSCKHDAQHSQTQSNAQEVNPTQDVPQATPAPVASEINSVPPVVAECRQGVDCKTPDKPICSNGVCVACSAEHACYQGICDTVSGRCVECVTSNDCTTRENGVCVSNVCTTCSASNCAEVCDAITGKCGPRVELPCPGGRCGEPGPIEPIDPGTFAIGRIIRPPVVIVPPRTVKITEPTIGTYKVDARVNGLFARVSTEFTIVNSNGLVLEGELEFPLPDGAVVSGYAIDINGVMADASIVEKKQARIAFENEVKKGIDPGLVEQVKGNAYRTRIYPIPANGSRRIRVDYTTPLTIAPNGDAALALPMPQTKLAQRDISISVAANMPAPILGGLGDTRFTSAEAVWRVESHDTNVENAENILVAMPKLPDIVTAVEHDNGDIFFAASVNIAEQNAVAVAMPSNFRVIWDASGSRKEADIAQARKVVEALPESASYALHIFRNTLEPVRKFNNRAELLTFIDTIAYDGGTDFEPLKALATQKFSGMTLFFTDGMDTISGALPEFGASSISLVSGATRDVAALRKISGGRVLNLDIVQPEDVLKQMTSPSPVVSSVKGANLDNIQGIGESATGRVTVLGHMKSLQNQAVLELSDGRTIPLDFPTTLTGGKTLATSWASRRINDLSPNADQNRDELLALGRRYSIVSPVSSMIVLDNINQYLEYDIEPNENLTELHAQWLQHRPSQAQQEAEKQRKARDWQYQLSREWESRIAWWNNPIPPKPRKSNFNEVFDLGSASPRRSARVMDEGDGGLVEEAQEDVEEALVENSAPKADAEMAHPSKSAGSPSQAPAVDAAVTLKAWDPNTPYLQAIKDAQAIFKTTESGYNEYLKQRKTYAASPAFYFDCASYFFAQKAPELATRILSNLSELSIDDVAMLRVYAWRLREAGELDFAILILRKVAKLRPDEAISWRDLALTLTMRAKKNMSADDAQEALELFHKAAFTPYERDDALWTAVIAIEEFNELAAWSKRQTWSGKAPVIPTVEDKFLRVLDTDLRIAMTWDADSTDIDMHVVEPSGEEVFYGNNRSQSGGLVSHDVTTGYGPEEFLHKVAPKGTYKVSTNYFASHQQSLVGPATITVTYFTNWGRPNQEMHTMSLRLDKQKDKLEIGSIEVK